MTDSFRYAVTEYLKIPFHSSLRLRYWTALINLGCLTKYLLKVVSAKTITVASDKKTRIIMKESLRTSLTEACTPSGKAYFTFSEINSVGKNLI